MSFLTNNIVVKEKSESSRRHSDVKKQFGTTVRALRKQLGFSQETLSERSDLHRTYVSDIERGKRNVSLENIERLAHALNVSVPDLFLKAQPAMFSQTPSKPIAKPMRRKSERGQE